jgi:hypothetical protein
LTPHGAICREESVSALVEAGAPGTEQQVIEYLSRRLHFLLEKYDPTDDGDWELLTNHQQEIFRATIRGLLSEPIIHLAPTNA